MITLIVVIAVFIVAFIAAQRGVFGERAQAIAKRMTAWWAI